MEAATIRSRFLKPQIEFVVRSAEGGASAGEFCHRRGRAKRCLGERCQVGVCSDTAHRSKQAHCSFTAPYGRSQNPPGILRSEHATQRLAFGAETI